MRLLFKQRLFSWFDSYDIFDSAGNTVYTVKGQLSWGHRFNIYDNAGNLLGSVVQKLFSFLPRFEIYLGEQYFGCISKEFSFLRPKFNIDFKGWYIEGDFFEWEYSIFSSAGTEIAQVSKEILKLTDTYVIDVNSPKDALCALMLVLAIDAEKCSRN